MHPSGLFYMFANIQTNVMGSSNVPGFMAVYLYPGQKVKVLHFPKRLVISIANYAFLYTAAFRMKP